MADLHYDHPRLAALYDSDSGWSADREFYLNLAGETPIDILDLGCGTGLICNAYAAKGHHVTGLDPSASMLDIARKTLHGKQINWHEAFSQNFELNKKFDLIIMTGHAFQVLLTDEDVVDTFRMVKNHLKPNGIFTFESRNPNIDWPSLWHQDYELALPHENVKISRRVISYKNERLVFEHYFTFEDNETLTSRSDLRFMPHKKITDCLTLAGLSVQNFKGSWDGGALNPATSKEMIFTLSLTISPKV